MDAARKRNLLFVARFLGALVIFYAVVALNPVNDHVVVPFTRGVVHASAFLLRLMQQPVAVAGTVLRTPRFALDVHNGCNGIEAMMLLAAAVLAFPATLRSRLFGLLAGCAAVQLLNLVRVASLVWVGEHHRALFDVAHVAVWQCVVILAAVSMFVFWSWKFAQKPHPALR
jgi:exosortase H (IPTLxxWG-CTERM-specific)